MRVGCFWRLFLMVILAVCNTYSLSFHSHLSEQRRQHSIAHYVVGIERPDPVEPPFHAPRKVSGGETTRYGVRNGLNLFSSL